MIKALVFDFDGLILETEQPCYQAWKEIYEDHGTSLTFDSYIRTIGSSSDHYDPYAHLEGLLGRGVDREAIRERRRLRHLELTESQPILSGVVSYLEDAKALGLRIGLASSSSREWVEGHLARLGLLPYFDTVKTSDDVQRTKPEPDLFLAAIAALGVQAGEAIVLEDSPNGVLAANRAGIFCVAVPTDMTRSLDFSHADHRLTSLADLPLHRLLTEVHTRGDGNTKQEALK